MAHCRPGHDIHMHSLESLSKMLLHCSSKLLRGVRACDTTGCMPTIVFCSQTRECLFLSRTYYYVRVHVELVVQTHTLQEGFCPTPTCLDSTLKRPMILPLSTAKLLATFMDLILTIMYVAAAQTITALTIAGLQAQHVSSFRATDLPEVPS